MVERIPPKGVAAPNRLREWRKFRGYTLEQAAELIGCTHSYMSLVERGKVPWNQNVLEAAAWAYRTSPAALLYADPEAHADVWANFLRVMHKDDPRQVESLRTFLRLLDTPPPPPPRTRDAKFFEFHSK
jgi:transcriptional regulator with XRE-family HTH domain